MDHKDDVASALEDLRRQLYRAQDESRREQFRFEVEKAELHLEVQVRKDATGQAKLSIGAAGAEAGGAAGQSRTHKLVLVLNVRDNAVNGPVEIHREDYRPGSARNPGGAGGNDAEGAAAGNTERDDPAARRPGGDAEPRTAWRG
ncbi:trypco2 family protein [Streptomyces sp. NPDC003480]